MIIGITGSIGCGKTTAAQIFKKSGFKVISADEISHDSIKKNSAPYKKIIMEFGNGILGRGKNIDRKKLGDAVFNDNKKLKILNSIMHPIIMKEIMRQKNFYLKNFFENIVIDAPLLLETKNENIVDKVIVIKTDEKSILKRLKNKYSKEKIKRILNSQMPLNEKLRYADFIIDNSKDSKYLKKQVDDIIKKFNPKD